MFSQPVFPSKLAHNPFIIEAIGWDFSSLFLKRTKEIECHIYFKTRLCFMRHFPLVPEWRALSGLGSDVKAGSSVTNKSKPIFLSPPSLLVLKVCDGGSRIGGCDLVCDLNGA